MEIRFNLTGKERKALVSAVCEIVNQPMNYLGAPTFAYTVGGCTIDRNGALTVEGSISGESNSLLLRALNERGYIGEVADRGDADAETEVSLPDAPAQATDTDGFTISIPKDGFTETTIASLEKLVQSKAALIQKALGAVSLRIEESDTALHFPWFDRIPEGEEVLAYTRFITALCAMVKEQKRVTAKEKPVDNEKYAFRCFLLRLGFIGEESKAARKILLRNLSGNGSFKSGQRKTETEESADAVHSDTMEVISDAQ